jgi:hypothetical protein
VSQLNEELKKKRLFFLFSLFFFLFWLLLLGVSLKKVYNISFQTITDWPSNLAHTAIMKQRSLFSFLLFSSVLNSITGVPSFTRGKNTQEEKQQELVEVIIDLGEVHLSPKSSIPGSRRNDVVEAFFAYEDPSSSEALKNEIHDVAFDLQDFLVSTRRTLHRHPELMYTEQATSAYIQKALKAMDISFTSGWAVNTVPDAIPGPGGYGVVADIGTGREPCVLLRADMDALPILEKTVGVDAFKSRNDGKMHACGHDGHTTMLLGAASVLKEMEDSINGTVRFMFQPAEEGGAGGKRMVEEGVLTRNPKPKQAFAMHLWPT